MIHQLLTPINILNKEEHKNPYIIFTQDFNNFESLLEVRDLIRDLKLVPIKSDEMQSYYHSFSKEELLNQIKFTSNIIYLPNNFPYLLPKDVSQNIIWIKEDTSNEEVISFLEKKIIELGENIILFERSPLIKTRLVKSSFPYIRHIHLWHKLY